MGYSPPNRPPPTPFPSTDRDAQVIADDLPEDQKQPFLAEDAWIAMRARYLRAVRGGG